MKNLLLVATILIGLSNVAKAQGALVDPNLQGFAKGEQGAQLQKVLVLLSPAVSLNTVQKPQRYDRDSVVKYYKEVSRRSSIPVLEDVQNRKITGVKITDVFWINSSFAAEVTPLGLKALAQHPAVTKIYVNSATRQEPLMGAREGKMPVQGRAMISGDYDFTSMGLDRLFKEKPQVNGTGALVGVIDTGVDGSHPALAGKVLAFWNGKTGSMTPPQDFDKHGTHVSGTIVGGDRLNNWIGVAPGAKLVVAGALIDYNTMLKGMQWFLDVENNPAVGKKVKAISCSWNTGGAPDQEVFYRAISAWEAAGILPVFSAGNAGPNPGSITPPHEFPGTFAVAAYGADGKIASFSSRGPGKYHNQPTQKPDLAAPGVAINSSIPGGQYAKFDGTSMATPHVTGTVALLLQIKPDFNPAQLKQVILQSLTIPAGSQAGQWNPNWGFGQLNAYNAVMNAIKFAGFSTQQMASTSLPMFSSPEAVNMKAVANATLGEVGGGVDRYENTQKSTWITAQDLN